MKHKGQISFFKFFLKATTHQENWRWIIRQVIPQLRWKPANCSKLVKQKSLSLRVWRRKSCLWT